MTMQRIWVAVGSVWAMLALVAVIAWARPAPVVHAAQAPRSVVVRLPNGKQRVVLLQPAAHATTQTSGVPR